MISVAPPISAAISHSSRRSSTLIRSLLPPSRRGRSVPLPPGRTPSELVRVEPRLLVDRPDQIAADARLHLLVNGHERLLEGHPLIRTRLVDLRAPRLPHRLEIGIVLLLGDPVGVGWRLLYRPL